MDRSDSGTEAAGLRIRHTLGSATTVSLTTLNGRIDGR